MCIGEYVRSPGTGGPYQDDISWLRPLVDGYTALSPAPPTLYLRQCWELWLDPYGSSADKASLFIPPLFPSLTALAKNES